MKIEDILDNVEKDKVRCPCCGSKDVELTWWDDKDRYHKSYTCKKCGCMFEIWGFEEDED